MLSERRRGSLLATSVSMVAIFLTVTVGAMAFFENSMRQAKADRWRYIAADAARSGLDFVMGWAEANIDAGTKLPRDWEMNDGDVIDPVRGFMNSSQGSTANKVGSDFGSVPRLPFGQAATPATTASGAIVSDGTSSEYVLGRYGDYVLSFKARIQQFRQSEDHPRQYKIGIVGRVRRAPTTGYPISSESKAIVAERTIIATLGKEPFSKYATLIDIDLVRNWVPGEVIEGPVHLNRGYPDANPGVPGYTMADNRSKMMIQAPGIFNAVNGVAYPIFKDAVTMTWNDKAATYPDTDTDYRNAITMKTNAGDQLAGTTAFKAESSKIFLAPENQSVINGGAGPKIVPDNLDMPRSSRARLASALGVPSGKNISDYPWFNANTGSSGAGAIAPPPILPDGVYIPTVNAMTNSVGSATMPAYQVTDSVAGCIYIRGNVEIMRMTANDTASYYIFQLGYGQGTGTGARRTYLIRANRANCQLTIHAFPQGKKMDEVIANGQNLDTLVAAGTPTTEPRSYGVWADGDIYHTFNNPSPPSNMFPFNGIIFVDLSTMDPARIRLATDPNDKMRLYGHMVDARRMPLTGNILCLGDPGMPSSPQTKRSFAQSATDANPTAELVDTRSTFGGGALTATSPASKLSIIAAGNVFIQNHLILRSLLGTDRFDPKTDLVTLGKSRDLLGIVADKQVVAGLCAPSTTARGNVGTVVHAAIAALGDPALEYDIATNSLQLNLNEVKGIGAYRGSFATEGLMPLFPTPVQEQYGMIYKAPLPGYIQAATANGKEQFSNSDSYDGQAGGTEKPRNPFYTENGYSGVVSTNPNATDTRGRLLVFGSVTQKKRGIVGVGNRSYDKDFRYDKRLLSIAPPMFPSSTNMVLRVSQPISLPRDLMPYNDVFPQPTDPRFTFLSKQ